MSKDLTRMMRERIAIAWRTPYSKHDANRYGLSCKLPSKAKQADRDMFNPNTVMKLFRRTGDLSLFKRRQGFYADISHLSSISSYADVQAAMQPIADAFYSLPSVERDKFGHDPMRFLDFAKNPANMKWLIEHGFVHDPSFVETKSGSLPTDEIVDDKASLADAP